VAYTLEPVVECDCCTFPKLCVLYLMYLRRYQCVPTPVSSHPPLLPPSTMSISAACRKNKAEAQDAPPCLLIHTIHTHLAVTMAQRTPSVYNASLDYGYNSSTYPDSYNKCTEELYSWPEVAILWCADTYVQTEYNCVSPYTCDQQPWCDLGPKSGYANRRILCATSQREY
jgi:hypothetical protein